MINIITADNNVSAILGNQHFSRDDEYRLSFLCVTVSVLEGTLLFHNLTKELVLIKSTLADISDDDYSLLVKKWFFVSLKLDECKLVKDVREFLHITYEKVRDKNITILPTTDCNARCFYCFERNLVRENMTKETALNTVSFIKRQIKPNERLFIRWFGGEPLTNTQPIDLICQKLKQENEIPFSSMIVTNGYLLNSPLLNHAIETWNLKAVQITLDGTEKIYNKAKAYIYSDDNPFQTVLNNIEYISTKSIDLIIRLNIDEYNIEDMFCLADTLSKRIQNKGKTRFNLAPLFEYAGAVEHVRPESTRKKLLSSIEELQLKIESCGFPKSGISRSLKATFCGADSKNSIVVLPNGNLIRCEHIIENEPVGTVYDSSSSFSDGVWKKYRPDKEDCSSCPIYPECNRPLGCKEGELCSPAIKYWKINELSKKIK